MSQKKEKRKEGRRKEGERKNGEREAVRGRGKKKRDLFLKRKDY